jgi:Domain of unknown function (DUF1707)
MAQRRNLRASDADREHVAERLRQATTEGRIAPDELEQRLETALKARTYGELDAMVADLPGTRPARSRPRPVSVARAHPLLAIAALPFAVAAVAIVTVAIITGLAALSLIWIAFAWFAFGHRGRYGWACASRHGRRGLGAYQRSSASGRYWA